MLGQFLSNDTVYSFPEHVLVLPAATVPPELWYPVAHALHVASALATLSFSSHVIVHADFAVFPVPPFVLYPVGHAVQLALDVPPVVVLYVSAGQFATFPPEQYFPFGHAAQLVAWAADVYCPSPHVVHWLAPAALYDPATLAVDFAHFAGHAVVALVP